MTSPIILASQSPRRAQLLRERGIEFEIIPPVCEELDPAGWPGSPEEYAESVSRLKAAHIAEAHPDQIVLAADTVVALDNRIFGKPVDREDARRILTALFGTRHRVVTGVTLCRLSSGRSWTGHDTTWVTMRPMSVDELESYLGGGQWRGKAGAYGIQDDGDPFVHLIEGSFSNVVGLPIDLVVEMLIPFGIQGSIS